MIIHVDMDAFYASVEIRERPELAGKPVIVGGMSGRGVVAAANYEAREFGIRSAMPTATALRLCRHVVQLPVRMDLYSNVSQQIHEIFARYTPLIEPLSLDEAFLDVTASQKLFGAPEAIAVRIKQDIKNELGLIASVGVAPNKFLAKLASDLDKPDGFVVVPQDVQAFLDPLPITRLWGVGKVAGARFAAMGVRTIAQLRRLTRLQLEQIFGKAGGHLWELAHGVDHRPVVADHRAKSISHETTFEQDIQDREALRAWLFHLTEQVAARLRRHNLRGRTVHIKVRYADFKTVTRAHTLSEATDVTQNLWRTASGLLDRRLPRTSKPVRLLGMGVSDFEHPAAPTQGDLFQAPEKQSRIDSVADEINARFGPRALKRGFDGPPVK